MEIWKGVVGHEDLYLVSSDGRIYSKRKSKILSVGVKSNGYKNFVILQDGKFTNKMIHRLVASAFIPNPENKPCVNHINGIKTDNRVENLEWCTKSHNMKEAYNIGLLNIINKKSVLNLENGIYHESITDVCRCYNITESIVRRMILKRKKFIVV